MIIRNFWYDPLHQKVSEPPASMFKVNLGEVNGKAELRDSTNTVI